MLKDNAQIKIIKKPDEISFDGIHDLLWKANQRNRERGVLLNTATMTPDELKERVGDDGVVFVAMSRNVLVGTLSVRFVKWNKWYCHGATPEYTLIGVDPDFAGRHVCSGLMAEAEKYLLENGWNQVLLDTAASNTHAIGVYRHIGFELIDYTAYRGTDHYSVVMSRWIKKRAYSKLIVFCRYHIKKIAVTLRYKPGRIKRFSL